MSIKKRSLQAQRAIAAPRLAVLLGLLCLPLTSHAGGFTSWGKVGEIYLFGPYAMVQLVGVSSNPDKCSSTGYYVLNISHQNYAAIYSSILAARTAGLSVQGWVSGCGGQGNAYPVFNTVKISG